MTETTDAAAIFAPLWRRKWMILAVAILVGVGSYLYYKRQPTLYSATTQVYLGNGAEEQSQISTSGSAGKKPSSLNPTTQTSLINSSIIREAVRARLLKEHKTAAVRSALKGKAKAKSGEKSPFISITGEAHSARGAALLVNTIAQAYVKRQNGRYRREVAAAISLTRRQVRRIEAGQTQHTSSKGKPGTAAKASTSTTATLQTATLASKINQLEANLVISEVTQVDQAKPKGSKLLGPMPKSNAIFGFVIGLLLAAFAAYALGRLDRRLRSLAAIEAAFQAEILTVLPAVKNPVVKRDGYPRPANPLREALWRLQTTLQVGHAAERSQERSPRVILCVSADAGDGKSSLIADLALAQAEAGERVAIIEANFRNPVQGKLLGLDGPQGLADVLAGRLTVEEAMQVVSLVRPEAGVSVAQGSGSTATVLESGGSVSALVGARNVANPPALLGRTIMTELPRSLLEEFDHVLVDAPSPLQVSDVLPLLSAVDGIILVARVGHTRATSAQRLMQLLRRTPSAPILGAVANAVSQSDIKKYGLAAQHKRGLRHRLLGR